MRESDRTCHRCEAHGRAAGQTGDCEFRNAAAEFLAGVTGDLFIDLVRAGAFEVGLDARILRGLRLTSF